MCWVVSHGASLLLLQQFVAYSILLMLLLQLLLTSVCRRMMLLGIKWLWTGINTSLVLCRPLSAHFNPLWLLPARTLV